MKSWKFIKEPKANAILIKELQERVSTYDKAMSCLDKDDPVRHTINKKCTECRMDFDTASKSDPEPQETLIKALMIGTGPHLQCIKNGDILWEMDTTQLLCNFSRWCALQTVRFCFFYKSEKQLRKTIEKYLKIGSSDSIKLIRYKAYSKFKSTANHNSGQWDCRGDEVSYGPSSYDDRRLEAARAIMLACSPGLETDTYSYTKSIISAASDVLALADLNNYNGPFRDRDLIRAGQERYLQKLVKKERR